jgi:hypothetical protein
MTVETPFVNISEAVRLTGISRNALYRRIKAGLLPTFESDRNKRVVLLARRDLLALDTPRPRPATTTEVSR